MTVVPRRPVVLLAVALLAAVSWLGPGVGLAMADPYDDTDATVEVAPDVTAEVPAVGDSPAEEPVPVEPQPEEPGAEPAQPMPTQPDRDGPLAPPPPADSGPPPDSATAGGRNDASSASQAPAGGDVADGKAAEIAPDHPSADPDATKHALDSTPEVGHARPADETTVTGMRSMIQTAMSSSSSVRVTQWSSAWVRYDQYYQPLVANPFPVPIQLVYTYANHPYVVTIAPLAQSLLSVPQPGVYSFTAVVPNTSGGVSSVSVGSFSGGGYVPKPGQPAPPKPAAMLTYDNVAVRFDLAGVRYDPIVVKKVVDLGDDSTTQSRKVLLDEETPAWGSWGQTTSGEREFTVTSTQSLPGLTAPTASAPPGYQLAVVATSAPSSGTSRLTWIALGLGVLAVLAVVAVLVLARRRQQPGQT